MKRSLVLAISVLALTAAAQPLFAAEADTPSPRERAAQRERAPASQAARQAPQRDAPAQSQSSSFTGSQAGGFGGGNAGGGGFADPVFLCGQGLNTTFIGLGSQPPCPGVPYTYPASHRIQATGGGYYSYSIPLFGWAVIGVQGEVAAGSIRSSNTQSNTHPTGAPFGPDLAGRLTSETYSSSFNQGTNGSVLFKFGVPIVNSGIMIYGLVGTTFARVDGSYSYTGTSCPAIGPCTSAYGALNWNQTRTGVAGGVGVEWAYVPGVVVKLEYRYTGFGNISQDVPITVTSLTGLPCSGSFCNSTAHIDITNLHFQTVRVAVGLAF
jgi:opacity protein-like surface antigen